MYSDTCAFGGLAAFAWIFVATAIVILVVLLSTFSSLYRKLCCNLCDAQRGTLQYVAPTFAALAPICTIVAVAFYDAHCIQDAKHNNVVTIEFGFLSLFLSVSFSIRFQYHFQYRFPSMFLVYDLWCNIFPKMYFLKCIP